MERSERRPRQTFKGKRVAFSSTQQYGAPVEKVFPFLCPVREYEFLPQWDCGLIYLDTGRAEEYGVFTTRFPRDGDDKDVWVISRYEPSRLIQFVRVNSLRTIVYTIRLQTNDRGGADLAWEQVITGLNPAGNEFVETLREEDFIDMIKTIETLLQHYMDTGEMGRLP